MGLTHMAAGATRRAVTQAVRNQGGVARATRAAVGDLSSQARVGVERAAQGSRKVDFASIAGLAQSAASATVVGAILGEDDSNVGTDQTMLERSGVTGPSKAGGFNDVEPDLAIMSMEQQQETQDVVTNHGPAETLDNCVLENDVPQSSVQQFSNVETIRSRMGRECRIATASGFPLRVPLTYKSVALVADGVLKRYCYFAGDAIFTLRWNCPKNVFGSFTVGFDYGSAADVTGLNAVTLNDLFVKVYADFQASTVVLRVPWFYPEAFVALNSPFSLGAVFGDVIGSATAGDFSWNPIVDIYLHFENVSVNVPTCFATMQGGVLSAIASVGSIAAAGTEIGLAASSMHKSNTSPEPSGQNVLRTFVDGLNLVRADGFDPAIPMGMTALSLKPKGGSLSFGDLDNLCAIPFYRRSPVGEWFVPNHRWFERVRAMAYVSRCDFVVTLHCHLTAFHSGRVRILYSPCARFCGSLSGLSHPEWAPSILWDVCENSSISFFVPYGSAMEYDDLPYIAIVESIPFQCGLGNVPPIFVSEVRATNVRLLGFGTTSILRVPTFKVASDVVKAVRAQASFGVDSWYTPVHSSESPALSGFGPYMRRANRMMQTNSIAVVTGPSTFYVGALKLVDATATYFPYGVIGKLFLCSRGWRGSVKVSIKMKSDELLRARFNYGTLAEVIDTAYIESASGILEVVVPYFSPHLFYNGESSSGPTLLLLTEAAAQYEVHISFCADIELFAPSYQIATNLAELQEVGAQAATPLGTVQPTTAGSTASTPPIPTQSRRSSESTGLPPRPLRD
eukprot:Blabericola_migrator_1__2425@NODE_1682_length_4011_cov_30_770030_g1091_i0_p1_GENE_NODE_1682_length_4011_cov_30_770030_g1091_i0NODE_1682_length_4011_cov_30_770030_g1091_i0_p1_ORF_typecomplete_len794_score41_42Rhv/PF00073_20/0_013Rhv/PF00073_20/1_1e11Rhv/PF00073_20/7_3Rhv/PF00073_20/1_6e02Waikav_capsid_1/PF12264_8/0_0074Waikav_capsid_1/PF12264_8/41Waikav_capsid_1/PF12264_8/2_1e02_NODE_1682_length_4011_cov_30_770030_g1091_i05872968